MNKEDKFKINDIIIFNPKYKEIKEIMGDKDYLEGVILAHTISKGLKVYANNSVFYLTRELLEKTNYDCIKLKYDYDCTIEVEEKEVEIINKKVERILAMWIKLNIENNNMKMKNEIEKIYNRDEIALDLDDRLQKVDDIFGEFQAIYPELNVDFKVETPSKENILTDDSKKEVEKIKEKYEKLAKELRDTANEVTISTLICESEQSLRNVLKAYGIIDKNGKIKIII